MRSQQDRFAEALRPALMGPRLAATLGAGSSTCHVLDAKYEPGVSAVILYEHAGRLLRGDLVDAVDGRDGEPAVATDVVAPGIRVCAFPHDPDLPGLPEVMDGARVGPMLAAHLGSRPGQSVGRRAVRCRVRLLRYRPGKRATVVVDLGAGTALVAKAYHNPAKAAAVAQEAPALAVAVTSRGVLRLAPTVAHLPELSLVVQQVVAGTPLDALLGSSTRGCARDARDGVLLAARALAELHDAPVVSSRQRPVDRELQRFGVRADRVGTVDPRLGRELALLAQRLTHLQDDLPHGRTGLVHGDCKPSQFLLSGRHVHLLDLDHCGVADQAADVGTFLASLRQLATRHALARRSPAPFEELAGLADVFLEAYLESRGEDDQFRARVRWQEGVALERKALRAFARAPRSPLAGALVQQAHRRLDVHTEAA